MPEAVEKIRQLNTLREENDYKYKIEVDGGITADNVSKVIEAGADMIVSGSYIYKSPDKFEAIRMLRG